MASRVLGFLRDILFAKMFGTDIFAQAFVVAFRLPNMLRDMIGEGATDAAIVPILTEYDHTRTKEEYWEAARVIFNMMLGATFVVAVLGVVFAPLLVRVLAPGFLVSPDKFAVTVSLTRVIFPYVVFLGMVAYSKGVLNSLNYFTTPAFSPVVLNVTMILSLLFLCPVIGIKGMVVGVLTGGFFELILQLRPLKARGFHLVKGLNLSHEVARRVIRLLLPRALGTAVYQFSVLIDTVLASFSSVVGAGGVAALYYSNRLVQLPLAVFGISLATAALPRMSKEAALKDMSRFRETIAFSLRTVFAIMLPATAGLMIMAGPIIRILFQRGEFTAYSTAITVNALFFYSVGLFAYAGIKILVSAFYSMGDTRTPVRTAALALVVNVALNLILMWPLKIGGLALATSIAAVTNFAVLYCILVKRIGDIGTAGMLSFLGRTLSATAVMSICTYALIRLGATAGGVSGVNGMIMLTSIVLASGIVYIISGHFLGVDGINKVLGLVKSRFK